MPKVDDVLQPAEFMKENVLTRTHGTNSQKCKPLRLRNEDPTKN
jgi:hypothetical protein